MIARHYHISLCDGKYVAYCFFGYGVSTGSWSLPETELRNAPSSGFLLLATGNIMHNS